MDLSSQYWLLVLGLAGPVGGFMGGLLGVLAGSWLAGRNERRQWLREERLQTYSGLLATGDALTFTMAAFWQTHGEVGDEVTWPDALREQADRLDGLYNRVQILASPAVRVQAEKYWNMVTFHTLRPPSRRPQVNAGEIRQAFYQAVRDELEV